MKFVKYYYAIFTFITFKVTRGEAALAHEEKQTMDVNDSLKLIYGYIISKI